MAIVWEGYDDFLIDTKKRTGKNVMAYGQTAITEDLYEKRLAAGAQIIDQAVLIQLLRNAITGQQRRPQGLAN